MLPSFPFMPCYLCMRHQLKLDIFLTSVRQSWTELLEEAAIWILGKQLNRNKIRNCECLVDRQTFFFPYLMFAIIESAQSGFCTMRIDWKVAVLKIQLLCRWFTDGSVSLGNVNFPTEVLLYTQYCWILSIAFVYWEVTVYFFVLCRIHVHWHHIVSKPQLRHALSKSVLKIILFFSFFFCFLYCR